MLPVSNRPIDNGAVFVSGGRIVDVGVVGEIEAPSGTPVQDLGEVMLMPGLVNGHCHLEYTRMAGQVPPGDTFTDWLQRIIRLKRTWKEKQFRDSWREGAQMLLDSGTTTVADIVSVPSLTPGIWSDSRLRVVAFLEMTGLLGDSSSVEIVESTVRLVRELSGRGESVGLSPHSLYSTANGLPGVSAQAASEEGWLTTTHLAESDEEFEMFQEGRGELYDWLADLGRDMSDCGGCSPVAVAQGQGMMNPMLLAAHVNRLGDGDAGRLGGAGAHVVHCPGSHDFFGHAPLPYEELVGAGVNVCLGTDSLASILLNDDGTRRLSMFDEMKRFASEFPGIAADQIVRMATMNGGKALGRQGLLGELTPGGNADCMALPYSGGMKEVYESVVQFAGEGITVMVAGEWAERKRADDRQSLTD